MDNFNQRLICLCVGKCDMHAKFGFLKAFMLNLPYIKMTKSEKKNEFTGKSQTALEHTLRGLLDKRVTNIHPMSFIMLYCFLVSVFVPGVSSEDN